MSIKHFLIGFWMFFLIFCVSMVFIYPQHFKPQAIADFINQFKNSLLIVFWGISILRGLTLIPNTPFVLAGTIIFPSEPFLVLAISLSGIIFSSTMIYYFSDYLGFGNYIERKYAEKIVKIKLQLQRPQGFIVVFLWAFMPFLPTDLVCYLAGVLRMNFIKYIFAITFGELIICSIYIFFYGYLSAFFEQF